MSKLIPLMPRRPLSLAIGLTALMVTAVSLPNTADAAQPATNINQATNTKAKNSAVKNFNIPAASLSQVLSQFAGAAGVALSFDASQFSNLNSQGLQGNYSVEEGFATLLAGTGTTAIRQANGDYVLQSAGAITLPAVKVGADTIQLNSGSAEVGYVTKEITQIGPWQGRALQDTPYSVNLVPKDLIENLQATSPDSVFKINPVIQMNWPHMQNQNTYLMIRGFQVATSARDGIDRQAWNWGHGTVMEEIERIEILNGLSGFMYGGGNIGGLINYVTKRPTDERLNRITAGNTAGESFYLHGDFGGQIDPEGRFGYRVNLVTQGKDTYADNLTHERDSFSAAFDWQVTDNLLLEINGLQHESDTQGRDAYWYLGSNAKRPDAEDINSDKTWGQKWTNQIVDVERLGLNANWQITNAVKIRLGYLDEKTKRSGVSASNTINADDTYNQSIAVSSPETIYGEGYFIFADWDVSTGFITHKLTTGYQHSDSIWRAPIDGYTSNVAVHTGLNLNSPNYFPEPNLSGYGVLPQQEKWHQQTTNFSIGDDIKLNDQWSALVGISQTNIIYDADAQGSANYDESAVTPTLSVIYKPREQVTTYISYTEALEQGGVAGNQYNGLPVVNEGEAMDPILSQQIELGIKVDIDGLLLTGALYEIDQSLEYYEIINGSQARLVQDGRKVHRGIELTATGKISENTTIIAGVNLLDANTKDNESSPALEGKTPPNVAERMYKLYGEYAFPSMPSLSINGAISYTGKRYGDTLNTDVLDSYSLVDIGARYVMNDFRTPLTLRLNLNNLTNQEYWSNQYFVGEPRTVSVSVTIDF